MDPGRGSGTATVQQIDTATGQLIGSSRSTIFSDSLIGWAFAVRSDSEGTYAFVALGLVNGVATPVSVLRRIDLTTGSVITLATPASGPGTLITPVGMAIAEGGDLLIADSGAVNRYHPDGAFVTSYTATVGGVPLAAADVAVGRGGDTLLIADGADDGVGGWTAAHDRVVVLSMSGAFPPTAFTTGAGPLGVAVDCRGRAYVAETGAHQVAVWAEPDRRAPPPCIAPDASGPTVGAVGATAATLSATIAPHGDATAFHVDYGPTSAYGASTPVTPAGAATTSATQSATVTGLAPATLYHARIVAESAFGSAATDDVTFTTPAAPQVLPQGSPSPVAGSVRTCRVPRLRNLGLAAARTRLKRSGCRTGKVTKPRHAKRRAKLIVRAQRPAAGATIPTTTPVTLTLAVKKHHH